MRFRDRVGVFLCTAFAKIKKALALVWRELIPIALCVVTAWAIVGNCDLHYQGFVPLHNCREIIAPDSTVQEDFLSGIDRRRSIENLLLSSFSLYAPDKYFPITFEISSWDRSEILDSSLKLKSDAVLCPSFRQNTGSVWLHVFVNVVNNYFTDSNVWTIGILRSLGGLVSRTSLPQGEGRISKQENDSGNFESKSLAIPGGLLIAGSIVFLYKIWWKISFNFSANDNTVWFVIQFIISYGLFVCGGLLILFAFGLLV